MSLIKIRSSKKCDKIRNIFVIIGFKDYLNLRAILEKVPTLHPVTFNRNMASLNHQEKQKKKKRTSLCYSVQLRECSLSFAVKGKKAASHDSLLKRIKKMEYIKEKQ